MSWKLSTGLFGCVVLRLGSGNVAGGAARAVLLAKAGGFTALFAVLPVVPGRLLGDGVPSVAVVEAALAGLGPRRGGRARGVGRGYGRVR